MDFSTDEKHKATLQVLAETLEYLQRMPPVQSTLEMCRKIEHHIQDPMHKIVSKREKERYGDYCTAAGMQLLEAHLNGDLLTLKLHTDKYGRTISGGVLSLRLNAVNGVPPVLEGQRAKAPSANPPAPVAVAPARKKPMPDKDGLYYE